MITSKRHLILVLGDQLDPASAALDGLDPDRDLIIMAEVASEIEKYPNHKQRVVLFLSAMRHYCRDRREAGLDVVYQQFDDDEPADSLAAFVAQQIESHQPERLVLLEPGRKSLEDEIYGICRAAETPIDLRPDRHFFTSHDAFQEWASSRKTLVMEHFYRMMRKQHGILVENGKPAGGSWNFDKENRGAFGREGPGIVPMPLKFQPDDITKNVIEAINRHYPDLPGSTDTFDWPVTPSDAEAALQDFVVQRLPDFGAVQDAMWLGEPYLYHARLSTALNMKLLDPRQAVNAAVEAWDAGDAPLSAVEGFVRQILGWREFIRGVYGLRMPRYLTLNEMEADRELPAFFWTGNTEMACVREVVTQILERGYAHHIQRLMVTGLFALLYRVDPLQVHNWYMAMFVDSIEWVTLPNTIGMSQFADGGIVGTKPYVATGKYINRMSNYCQSCRFDPNQAAGDDACPFTSLYWDYLMKHEDKLADNRRMAFQMRNLRRKTEAELNGIRERVVELDHIFFP